MSRSASPAATASMKLWDIPAPAPWANTKQALASLGTVSNALTLPIFSTLIATRFEAGFCIDQTNINPWKQTDPIQKRIRADAATPARQTRCRSRALFHGHAARLDRQ